MFPASADCNASCDACKEGWIVSGECVKAERSDGLERISARSCLLHLPQPDGVSH